MAHGEEDGGLGQAVDQHVEKRPEGGHRPAQAEGEGGNAHVLDGGIGEHALDVLLPEEGEGRHEDGDDAEAHHDVAGMMGPRGTVHQDLAPHESIERDVQ